MTEQQILMRNFNKIIKDQQERGVGTGAECTMHWRSAARGERNGKVDGVLPTKAAAGNSANAVEVANAHASKVNFTICSYFCLLCVTVLILHIVAHPEKECM